MKNKWNKRLHTPSLYLCTTVTGQLGMRERHSYNILLIAFLMPHCPVTVVQRYRDGVCSLLFHLFFIICHPYIPLHLIFNPRRACARVTVLVLCVCVSVYPSVPALAASASVETSKQRYSRVSLRLFLD